MPAGFGDVYRRWAEAGWGGVSSPAEFGGMGLPHLVNVACTEIWNGASMAFALCPLLTEGAIGALKAHGSRDLLDTYLAAMISGRWTGTMNLTEPQAGSDLNAVRTRAERAEDGTYRLFGQKIFITYGEHDMAENIVHLVLARLSGAPAGTRGLSLFVAPKFIVNPDASLGSRNDLRCASIEHKLGIHASPTCVMLYGESEGAKAWLVGEENRGLAAMFVMMNAARLAVGTQGVAIGERAYQQALAFARDRRQGRRTERRRRHGADHRTRRRSAHADDDEGVCACRARNLPSDRRLARSRQSRPHTGGADGRRGSSRAADADRQGVLDRRRRRSGVARRADPRRHGLHRRNRRRSAYAGLSHRRDLRRRQRHTRHRPGAAQAAARRRRNGQERNRRNSGNRRSRRRARRRDVRRDGSHASWRRRTPSIRRRGTCIDGLRETRNRPWRARRNICGCSE